MTDPHELSPEEAFVQRYLLGACSNEEVAEQLAKNPDLALRLREMDAVKDLLADSAAEEESVLTEAKSVSFPLGEQRLAEAIQETLSGDGGGATGPRPLDRRWVMAAAAAAILLVMLVPDWGGRTDPGPDPGPSLNNEKVLLHAPEHDGERWGAFRFDLLDDRDTLPEIRIRVFQGKLPIGTPLAESPPLLTSTGSGRDGSWIFPDATLAEWGEELTWQVVTITAGNHPEAIGTWPSPVD